jgi:hypothetical protein
LSSLFPRAWTERRQGYRIADIGFQQNIFDPACPDCVRSSAMEGAEVSLEVELPTETYSLAEVSRALRDLSAGHKTLLVKIARAYARKTSYSYEDLIQEAISAPSRWKSGLNGPVPHISSLYSSRCSSAGPMIETESMVVM